MNKDRTEAYQRNHQLMEALKLVNGLLEDINLPESKDTFSHRPIFIVGCARSGSTLFLQWLANSGLFCYPSNIIARFYKNPYFGALVQKILLEYDAKNQIFHVNEHKEIAYNSNLGHTRGPLAPSEFWYFWREYFNFEETQKLSQKALEKVKIKEFINHLTALEELYQKPLAIKGHIVNWNIPYLYKNIPNALFIWVKRDPLFTAQSVYLSRIKFFNDEKKWWSSKPPEYTFLKELTPLKQVAGQVFYTNHAVAKGLNEIPADNKLSINYEALCANPAHMFKIISERIFSEIKPYHGSRFFSNQNNNQLSSKKLEALKTHLDFFYKKKVNCPL